MLAEPLMPPLDTPFEPAPALPSGPALLDDTESNMLDSFFTSMNSSQLDNDFWFQFGDPMNSDVKFGFEWQDIPPNFEGSTTSLPPHPSHPQHPQHPPPHTSHLSQHHPMPHSLNRDGMMMDRGRSFNTGMMGTTSMPYQNGSGFMSTYGNQIYTENGVQEVSHTDFKAPRFPTNTTNGNGPLHQNGHFARDIPMGIHTNKMVFDTDLRQTDQGSVGKLGLKWGSDAAFGGNEGYQAPPDQPTLEERTTDLLQQMDCLESQSSAAPTRASSPNRKFGGDRNATEWTQSAGFTPVKPYLAGENNTFTIDDNTRPAKRRKSKVKMKEEDRPFMATFGKGPNNNNNNNNSIQPATTKDRRFSSSDDQPRRSKASSTKPARENLTEEQKRTNHILSEQKRRNLIKQGFEELCNIVPQLQGGGYSKSTMLIQAANWLQDMLQGNELLKSQLADLKGH